MKRALLVSFGLIMLGSYAGCLPEETTATGTGGSQGTAGTGSPGTAGTGSPGTAGTQGTAGTGIAGTTGTGGTAGSQGGDTSGTAGNGTAGSGTAGTGTAGSGTGGTGGTGTAGSGTAGTTSRGGTGGTGTAGSGTAGTTSRGGTGGTGTAGSAGGTGGGGGATAGAGGTSTALPPVAELFPSGTDGSLDGRLLTMPCNENTTGTDCASAGADYRGAHINCTGGALNVMHTYPVGGVTGRQYKVTIHFYGIAEPKNYGGVTREATGTTRPNNSQTNGGMSLAPTPWAQATSVPHTYNVSDYNTNEIHVYEGTTERAAYYLNADTQEGHYTYVINYAKQITVYGGGTVRVRNYDRNCRMIKNCGSVDSYPCASKSNQRVITIPATVMPAVPAGALTQPNLSSSRSADNAGQWLLIDVESVDSQM